MIEDLSPKSEGNDKNEQLLLKDQEQKKIANQLEENAAHAAPCVKGLVATLSAAAIALGLQSDTPSIDLKTLDTKLSIEQLRIVETVTGIRYPKLSEKFEVKFSLLAGPEGKYIVHIGQRHEHPEEGFLRQATFSAAVDSQQKIEGLLLSMIKANRLQGIFSEGVYDSSVEEQTRAVLERDEKTLDDALRKDLTFQDLASLHSLVTTRHGTTLNYLGPKIEALQDKVQALLPSLQPKSPQETYIVGLYENMLSARLWEKRLRGTPYSPYLPGAVFKLYKEKRLEQIYPAENLGLNQRAMQTMQQIRPARRAYDQEYLRLLKEFKERPDVIVLRNEFDSMVEKLKATSQDFGGRLTEILEQLRFMEKTMVDDKIVDLKDAADKAAMEEKRATNLDREWEVLRSIDRQDEKTIETGKPIDHVVVVYGSAHDFQNAAESWNSRDATMKIRRGVMKISEK